MFFGFHFQLQSKIDQKESKKSFSQIDKTSPLYHVLHQFSLSEAEKSMNRPSKKKLRQNENSHQQPITPHEEPGEKNAANNHAYNKSCI